MKKLLSTFVILFVVSILQITAQNRVYTPNQVAPENGEVEQSPNAILSWDAVSGVHGIVSYDVQVATDAAFTNIIVNTQTTLGGYQNADLIFGNIYYWRVRAIDGPDISDWSTIWSFKIQYYSELTSPAIYKINADVKIEMKWKVMEGIYEYQVQYDTSYFWKVDESVNTPDLNDVAILNETNAWAVGNDGHILHFDGTTWEINDSISTVNINSVAFFDENNAFAVGDGGLILKYDGASWTDVSGGATTANLYGVDFGDASNAWAVGASGAAVYWDGTSWTAQTSGITDKDLTGVSFTSPSNGWAVGKGGKLISYDTAWHIQTSPISGDLYGISLADATNGWAVGKSGKMMKYDGTEWTEIDNLTTKNLNSVKMRDANNAYAIGADGAYLVFNGNYWVQQSVIYKQVFNASLIFSDNFGIAVGEGGTILKYDGVGFTSPDNILTYSGSVQADSLQFLSYGFNYFWRVRGVHNTDTSEWSPVYSFTTKGAVELEYPANNDDEVFPLAEFKWKRIGGTDIYTIQIDVDPNFSAPTTYTTKELINTYPFTHFGESWYWRVKASHIKDSSPWSEERMFTIINTVNLTSPSNGAVNVQVKPTLNWEVIDGVESFEILYDTLNDFSTATPQFILAPNHEYKMFSALKQGKEYYWKVKAVLGYQETEWSDIWSFTVTDPQSIQELFDNSLNIYPNPSNGSLNISFNANENTEVDVTVTDLVGQVHQQETLAFGQGSNIHKLNLQELANGIYIVRITSGDAFVTRKISLYR